jgi:cell division protein FtsB
MNSSRKRTALAAAVALCLAGVSAADASGLRRFFKLRREIATYEQKNQELTAKNASLRLEIEALSGDKKALERAAREDLGLVRPDEVIFNFDH